jgi:hypothetical protein
MDYSSTNYFNSTNTNNSQNNSAKKNYSSSYFSAANNGNSNNNSNSNSNSNSSTTTPNNLNKANNQRRARHYSSSQNKKRFKHHYSKSNNANTNNNNENNYYSDAAYNNAEYSHYYNSPPTWYYPQQKQVRSRWSAPVAPKQPKSVDYDYNQMPNVVLQKIFGYLSLKDRLVASSTCSNWRQALYSPSLWQSASLTVYLCMRTDVESAAYKMNSFARFASGVVIKYSPFNEYLLNELDTLLEVVKCNRGLREITFYPIFDNYSTKTPNIEKIHKK